jgi:hypothetical protein
LPDRTGAAIPACLKPGEPPPPSLRMRTAKDYTALRRRFVLHELHEGGADRQQ